MNFESSTDGSKACRDIWGSGQGIGADQPDGAGHRAGLDVTPQQLLQRVAHVVTLPRRARSGATLAA